MASLKISDLSVGDWVEWRGNICTICSIYGATMSSPDEVALLGKKIPTSELAFVGELRPIPITAEVLEKNGWSTDGMYATLRINEYSHLEYYYHEHRLRKYCCSIDEWENHKKVPNITFAVHCFSIHQLQHAMRLAGVDKEINL